MHKIKASVIGMFVALFVVTGSSGSAPVPDDLTQAMRERDASLSTGLMGVSTWERLTADDFTAVSEDGQLQTRAQQLALLKESGWAAGPGHQPPPPLNAQVQVYGDSAVRRFQRSTNKAWALEVWVKSRKVWRIVAVQYTATK